MKSTLKNRAVAVAASALTLALLAVGCAAEDDKGADGDAGLVGLECALGGSEGVAVVELAVPVGDLLSGEESSADVDHAG